MRDGIEEQGSLLIDSALEQKHMTLTHKERKSRIPTFSQKHSDAQPQLFPHPNNLSFYA
jgi:hypothetical protein